MALNDAEVRQRVQAVEALLARVEALPEESRATALDTVQVLVELYGEALERLLSRSRENGKGLMAFAVEDELLSHLLLLHGLHPAGLETRILEALDEIRPYLTSHGGDVELVGVEGATVRLRLSGSCDGCPSSAATLRLAVEEAILARAPEIEAVEADGVSEPEPRTPGLVPVEALRRKGENGDGEAAAWRVVGSLPSLAGGGATVEEVDGHSLLFLRLGDDVYAYRRECPACGEALGQRALEGEGLRCPGCGKGYDARKAGRCLDAPDLQLAPVPLLQAPSGLVKVAVGEGS